MVCIRSQSAAIQLGGFAVGDGNLLGDLYVEALQGWDVRGRIREQADFVDAEVGEDLAA